MRGIVAIVALVAAVAAVSLSGYVSTKLVPLGNTVNSMDTNSSLLLASSAFSDNGSIPSQFTCDGSQTNPPVSIAGVPDGTKSFALIMDDPDIPQQFKEQMHIDAYIHWVLFNIPPETTDIGEREVVGTPGANTGGNHEYAAPCPPAQYEPSTHRYIFKLYALDTMLPLKVGATWADIQQAIAGHVIAQTQLTGLYKRK